MAIVRYMNFANSVLNLVNRIRDDFCKRNYCGEVIKDIAPDGKRKDYVCDPKEFADICPIAALRKKVNTFFRRDMKGK